MTREQTVLYAEAQENTPGYHAKKEPVRLMQMTPTLCLMRHRPGHRVCAHGHARPAPDTPGAGAPWLTRPRIRRYRAQGQNTTLPLCQI